MRIRSLAFRQAVATIILALGAPLLAAPAIAGEAPAQQVLDRVYAYNAGDVLNMHFGNALRPPDFTDQQASASLITACTLTSVDGLWCLDGGLLRKWTNPLDLTGAPEDVLSCTDPALGFETTCTGMTVDKSGVIWLAGKKRPTTNGKQPSVYIVVKVTEKGVASCAPLKDVNELSDLDGVDYCATEAYNGKYEFTQLSPVDGDAAKAYHAGVLGIENLENVVFFPSAQAQQPVLIPGSPQGNPKFGEVLDDVSFVVFNNQGYVVATTNSGHVLAKNVTTGTSVLTVFKIPAERNHSAKKCSNAKSQYAIRGAPSSSIVFVSDRQYCQVLALGPNANFTALDNLPMPGGSGDFTLSTVDNDAPASFPTFGLTVASGIAIDFTGCVGSCNIINAPNVEFAVKLEAVQLASPGKSGATVFQLKNIPDCRYAGEPQFPVAMAQLCASLSGVVVNRPGAPFDPAAQMLNVIPLLPADVTSAFDSGEPPPNGLPEQLLISPQYRAQNENNYVFAALFVVPGKHVKYKGVFKGHYDVPALEGDDSLGCEPTANLLDWDVTTAVSETYVSVDGKYIDSLANDECGSIRGSYGRLSFLPYNLEITPDTYGLTLRWWEGPKLTTNNDAVFGRLIESLIDDLDYVFKELACGTVDPNEGATPLAPGVCQPFSPARVQLALVKAQFDLCMVGAFRSQAFEDSLPWYAPRYRPFCESTLTRLSAFEQALPPLPGVDDDYTGDIANRLGELHSRISILRHVYTTRLLPLPAAGFCKELNTCSP
jgi:hypothetical protein